MRKNAEKNEGRTENSGRYESQEFHRLFREHNESLVRFLATKLGSKHEANDVAQEAYVRILGLDNQDVINHLRAYLFRTANNIAIDRLRERQRRQTARDINPEDANLVHPEPSADRRMEQKEQLALIKQAISELPPKCRLAFMLFKFECMDYREIAEQMNLTESMIRKYVLRAVRYCKTRTGTF